MKRLCVLTKLTFSMQKYIKIDIIRFSMNYGQILTWSDPMGRPDIREGIHCT